MMNKIKIFCVSSILCITSLTSHGFSEKKEPAPINNIIDLLKEYGTNEHKEINLYNERDDLLTQKEWNDIFQHINQHSMNLNQLGDLRSALGEIQSPADSNWLQEATHIMGDILFIKRKMNEFERRQSGLPTAHEKYFKCAFKIETRSEKIQLFKQFSEATNKRHDIAIERDRLFGSKVVGSCLTETLRIK